MGAACSSSGAIQANNKAGPEVQEDQALLAELAPLAPIELCAPPTKDAAPDILPLTISHALSKWRHQVVAPTHYSPKKTGIGTNMILEMDHIHGYRGQDLRSNAVFSKKGDIVYHAAGVGIVVEAMTRQQLFYREHSNDILCLTMHPDGDTVATGEVGPNPVVRIWSANTLETITCLAGAHAFGVGALTFCQGGPQGSPGTLLASAGMDSETTLILWNWRSGTEMLKLRLGVVKVFTMAFKPGKMDIAICGLNRLAVWRLGEGPPKETVIVSTSNSNNNNNNNNNSDSVVVQSQDVPFNAIWKPVKDTDPKKKESTLVGVTSAGNLYQWTGDGSLLQQVRGVHRGPIYSVALTRDGIITGGSDGCIQFWTDDLQRGERVFFFQQCVRSLSIRGDSVLIGTRLNELYQYSVTSKSKVPVTRSTGRGSITDVAAHPTQPIYITLSDDNFIRMWNFDTHTLVRMHKYPNAVSAAFSQDGGTMIAIGTKHGSVHILDSQTLAVVSDTHVAAGINPEMAQRRVGAGGKAKGRGQTPVDPSTLSNPASAGATGVTQAAAGEDRHPVIPVTALQWAPDSSAVAVAIDQFVYILDVVAKGKQVRKRGRCEGHTTAVLHVDWDKESKFLQSMSEGNDLRFWEPVSCTPLEAHDLVNDADWAEHFCTIGWAVKGSWADPESTTRVLASNRSNSGDFFASLDSTGALKVFPYPCPGPDEDAYLSPELISKLQEVKDEGSLVLHTKKPMEKGKYNELNPAPNTLISCRSRDATLSKVPLVLKKFKCPTVRYAQDLVKEMTAWRQHGNRSNIVPVFSIWHTAPPHARNKDGELSPKSGGTVAIVMEKEAQESRGVALHKDKSPSSEARVLEMLSDCAQALSSVHKCGLVHARIRPDTLFMGRDGEVDVGHPGFTETLRDIETCALFSGAKLADAIRYKLRYWAPELLRMNQPTSASDIWSLAVSFYELITGRPAFPETHITKFRDAVFQVDVAWSVVEDRFPRLVPILQSMLAAEPSQRCSAGELVMLCRDAGSDQQVGHSRYNSAAFLAISHDDRYILTVGADDHTVIQWSTDGTTSSNSSRTVRGRNANSSGTKTTAGGGQVGKGRAVTDLSVETDPLSESMKSMLLTRCLEAEHSRRKVHNSPKRNQMMSSRRHELDNLQEKLALKTIYGGKGQETWNCVHYTADGRVVYPVGNTAVVLSPSKGKKKAKQSFYREHTGIILSLAVQRDKNLVATGQSGENPSIRVWNLDTLETKAVLIGPHAQGVVSLSFTPDSKNLFSVGMGAPGTIALWSWVEKKCLYRTSTAVNEQTLAGLVSPFGDAWFVTCGPNHVQFWGLNDKGFVQSPPLYGNVGRRQTVLCLTFIKKGVALMGTASGHLYAWTDNKLVLAVQAHDGPVTGLFHCGDEGIASAGIDGQVHFWSPKYLKKLRSIDVKRLAQQKFPGVSVSIRDLDEVAGYLLVATTAGHVYQIKIEVPQHKLTVLVEGASTPITALDTHPRHDNVFVTGTAHGVVRLWNADTSQGLHSEAFDGKIISANFAPDASNLTVLTESALHVINASTFRKVKDVDLVKLVLAKTSNDGNKGNISISTTATATTAVGNGSGNGNNIVAPSKPKHSCSLISYSPNSRYVAIARFSTVFIMDTSSWKILTSCLNDLNRKDMVTGVQWSQDSSHLLIATRSGGSLLFRVPIAQLVSRSPPPDSNGKGVGRSNALGTGGKTGQTRNTHVDDVAGVKWASWQCPAGWAVKGLWDEAPGALTVTCAHSSPKGHVLAAGDSAGRLSVRPYPCPEVAIGPTANAHATAVSYVRFNCDGSRLFTIGEGDQSISEWRLSDGKQGDGNSDSDSVVVVSPKPNRGNNHYRSPLKKRSSGPPSGSPAKKGTLRSRSPAAQLSVSSDDDSEDVDQASLSRGSASRSVGRSSGRHYPSPHIRASVRTSSGTSKGRASPTPLSSSKRSTTAPNGSIRRTSSRASGSGGSATRTSSQRTRAGKTVASTRPSTSGHGRTSTPTSTPSKSTRITVSSTGKVNTVTRTGSGANGYGRKQRPVSRNMSNDQLDSSGKSTSGRNVHWGREIH